MSSLFTSSMQKWQQVALHMNATYHLWTAEEVDTLIRQKYAFMWETYKNVRYPVMRADMGRVAILHYSGGIYSDMDVYPNRMEYMQRPLTVCVVPARDPRKKFILDMEVLIGEAKNPLLLQWLRYMVKRVKELKWKKKNSFWGKAKMRYIWWTTGLMSMMQFLRLAANKVGKKQLPDHFTTMQSNRPDQLSGLSVGEQSACDVISHQSISYKTSAHCLRVPVSTVNVPLPVHHAARILTDGEPSPKRRRIRGKQLELPIIEAGDSAVPVPQASAPAALSQPNHGTESVANPGTGSQPTEPADRSLDQPLEDN